MSEFHRKDGPMSMNPCPCLVCGKVMKYPWSDEMGYPLREPHPNQPDGGTAFDTTGNYGSTVIDGGGCERLEIAVCDECLKERIDRTRRLYRDGWKLVPSKEAQ